MLCWLRVESFYVIFCWRNWATTFRASGEAVHGDFVILIETMANNFIKYRHQLKISLKMAHLIHECKYSSIWCCDLWPSNFLNIVFILKIISVQQNQCLHSNTKNRNRRNRNRILKYFSLFAQMGYNHDKNRGEKSRDTLPLIKYNNM